MARYATYPKSAWFTHLWEWLFGPITGAGILIAMVLCKNVLDATVLLLTDKTDRTISMGAMLLATPKLSGFDRHYLLAGVLFVIALCARQALVNRSINHTWVFVLLVPQQVVLWIIFAGSALSSWHGVYFDGTAVPGGGWHIFVDQVPRFLLAPFHTVAIIARAQTAAALSRDALYAVRGS